MLSTNILTFSGSTNNGKNVLQWSVTVNSDIKEYEIEKSTDGVHFSKIGLLTQLTSTEKSTFVFTGPENISNTNYYRIKLLSGNTNAASYSKTIILYNRSLLFKILTISPFAKPNKYPK